MMRSKILFCLLVSGMLMPLSNFAQIHDSQISRTVEKYFARSRTAPMLISTDIVDDIMYGRTLKIKIVGHRNRENAELGFAFGAAAAVANRADVIFDQIWVEMDVRYKETETTIASASAKCSIDCIVTKVEEYDYWWKNCLEFL
jgi:hypothetical protein